MPERAERLRCRIIPAHAGNSRSASGSQADRLRIIPAHAGNSDPSAMRGGHGGDHPRACGELLLALPYFRGFAGSSPRMRGTPAETERRVWRDRIIPAHAGNSLHGLRVRGVESDHPRACGELQRG